MTISNFACSFYQAENWLLTSLSREMLLLRISTSHVIKILKDSFSVTQVLLALSGLPFSPSSVSIISLWCFQWRISEEVCSFVWFFHLVAELGQAVPVMAYRLPSADAPKQVLSNSVFCQIKSSSGKTF